jgi:putative ABC transport system permease protein
MFKLAVKNLRRRPLRSSLTAAGIAAAVAVLLLIDQVATAYRTQLFKELNTMGVHLMLVPLGCPYDAAARVLKGNNLENSLPEEAVAIAKADPDVEIAAPMLIAALPSPAQGRTDMFVGLDESGIALKAWWQAESGADRFESDNSVILGADAAQIEMRSAGDALYSPETRRTFKVAGVLKRSGTSDDSLFFVPLRSAQTMFHSANRVTAVAMRLRDPAALSEVSARLQDIPGAQVVTQTEMMGTFLNILGGVRALLQSIALVALCASVAGLVNTLLMSVAERRFEFSLFRAIGASRGQLFGVILAESLLLTVAGIVTGALLCLAFGTFAVNAFGSRLPYLDATAFTTRPVAFALALGIGVVIAIVASFFPAWRAVQVQPAQVLKGVD